MTLVLLALDALDAVLVDRFDTDTYRLDSYGSMATVAGMREQPYTPEAWATAATGLRPSRHGVSGPGTSDWNNPLLNAGSLLTSRLPEQTRGMLGAFFEQRTGVSSSVGQTDCETVFDRPDCVVRNWPGVTDGQELQQAWDLMTEVGDTITREEFERELFGLCAAQFAWVEEMLNHDVPLAGVHIHTLDAAGHAYCENEPALREVYERVAEFVGRLRRSLSPADELLILSDHGMTVSFYSDDHDINTPGNHAWRAFSSTTTGPRPDEIGELPKWVDSNIRATSTTDDASALSIPDEQLRQLGYIE